MSYIKQYTQFVTGTEESEQTYGSTSAATAFGVFKGIQAIADYQFTKSIKDLHIAIQGLGSVGYRLAKLLFEAGAKLTLCDINHDLAVSCAKEFNAHRVEPNDVYKVDCDIFSPCALGEIINTETVPLLQTKVIAGAANNQLSASEIVSVLHKRGIIYIPDYIINAGGFIHLALQIKNDNRADNETEISKIYERVLSFMGKTY
jgi:leucine dehydrogenase